MNSFKKLVQVMSRLRSPSGCPWDREQTHQSLLKYLYEESDELKQSIRKKDFENMEEELGDVLLQVLFHSQLAKEAGRFTIEDVVRTLTRKLTLRHPHVFGYRAEHRKLLKGKSLKSSKDIVLNWDLLKRVSGKKRR
jgi:tetrapyrrole methylase family protein / MazG family protein